jgi:hypothetical protein
VVDLAAAVAVTVQQCPLVSQDRPQAGCHYVLTGYPGGKNRLLVGDTVLHRVWPRLALNRRPGTPLPGAPCYDGGLGPAKPAALSASAIPVLAQGGEACTVPGQRFLVPRECLPVLCPFPVRGGLATRVNVLQHLGRMIRQRD